MCCRSDCELESFSESPSSIPSKSYHTRDHTYSYDKLRRLSATSESMSLNYWPVAHYPTSVPCTYFHPILTPPPVMSLAPLIASRASEMPSYFVRSSLAASHVTMAPVGSVAARPTLGNSQSVTPSHQGRGSLLPEFPICTEVPLDLTVVVCQHSTAGLPPALTVDTLVSSRSSGMASAVEFPANVTTNSGSYLPPPLTRSFNPETPTTRAVVKTTSELSETSVTANSNDSALVNRRIQSRASIVDTASDTDASVLQTFPASADTKPVITDAAVMHHVSPHSTSSQPLGSHTDRRPSTTPDLKAAADTDVTHQDISGRMTTEVECSVTDSLQPSLTCPSLHYAASLQTGMSCSEVGQVSDDIADYPPPSEISKPPHESSSAVAAAVPFSTDDVHSTKFSPVGPGGDGSLDIESGPESGGGLDMMEVDASDVLGSAEVPVNHSSNNQPQSTYTEASGDKTSNEKLLMMSASVQTNDTVAGSSTDDAVINKERSATREDIENHDSLPLHHPAEMLNALSEKRTDPDPVSDSAKCNTGATVSENGDDHKDSLNAVDSSIEAVGVDITGRTPVSAINTASAENVESKPGDRTVSEPSSAAVAMKANAPAGDELQKNAAVVCSESIVADAAVSTATTETERNERFKELMVRCRKAMELCLTRFPQHYKSLYRLADIFFRCSSFKVRHAALCPIHDTDATKLFCRVSVSGVNTIRS